MTNPVQITVLGSGGNPMTVPLVDAMLKTSSPVQVVVDDEPTARKCLALGAAGAALFPEPLPDDVGPLAARLTEAVADAGGALVISAADRGLAEGLLAATGRPVDPEETADPEELATLAASDAAQGEADRMRLLIFDGELPPARTPGLKDIMAAKKVGLVTFGETPAEPAEEPGETALRPAQQPTPRPPEPEPGPEPEPEPEPEPTVSVPEHDEPVPGAPGAPAAPAVPTAPARATRVGTEAQRRRPSGGNRHRFRAWTVGVLGAVVLVGAGVLLAKGLMHVEAVQDFVRRYPGAAPRPESTPVGLPGWLGWQHFLNAFFMVLIIATGIRIRRETRPPATWTSRRSGARISLTVWLHQGIDLLWIINGVVFVVLLFATGQWLRVVPTDWGVFPNALSAGLQYLSLDWPSENGWVVYNALQQLTYFVTVFLAAPLAGLTGWRMSTVWPARLDRMVPMAAARRVHFPVMLYFVAFVVVHVGLVLATGMKRNLGHIFAADDAGGWAGFVTFVLAVIVMGVGWALARPSVVAPVARLFGDVSSR